MTQSSLNTCRSDTGLHVAVIMDGNGRWALGRRLPRSAGHRAGAKAVQRVVEEAPRLGIGTLTLFAFSSDNWRRPGSEVEALMRLFETYLNEQTKACIENGVRVCVIGRRDRLPAPVEAAIQRTESATRHGQNLYLRLAVDYSGRDAILHAASRLRSTKSISRELFSSMLSGPEPDGKPAPDVDLLIRTGGEQRLSDFLLWEVAYAELFFTPRLWPDFDEGDLGVAVAEFNRRDRRFGRVSPKVAAEASG
jgi:undecaprenyl diphosphate synthase